MTWIGTRLAVSMAMLGGIYAAGRPANAQEVSSLDPAGVRGVRYMMRDDARTAAIGSGADTLLDWHAAGLTRPGETVTPIQVRTAFEGNVIQAERRFAQPFVVSGTLHSVARRADRQIVVTFVEGGLADSQRRALAGLGARGAQPDPTQILGGLTGGRVYAGATAVVPPEHEDTMAGWEPGAKVTLHCRGASNVPLAVLLDNCVPRGAVIVAVDRLADAQSDLVLSRKPLTIPSAPKRDKPIDPAQRSTAFLFMTYAYGLMARNCPDNDLVEWMKCTTRAIERPQPGRLEAAFRQAFRDLGISDGDLPRSETPPSPRRTTPGTRK